MRLWGSLQMRIEFRSRIATAFLGAHEPRAGEPGRERSRDRRGAPSAASRHVPPQRAAGRLGGFAPSAAANDRVAPPGLLRSDKSSRVGLVRLSGERLPSRARRRASTAFVSDTARSSSESQPSPGPTSCATPFGDRMKHRPWTDQALHLWLAAQVRGHAVASQVSQSLPARCFPSAVAPSGKQCGLWASLHRAGRAVQEAGVSAPPLLCMPSDGRTV